MATSIQNPAYVPPTRPAPTPGMTRPVFVTYAFNFTADLDPFRVGMNNLSGNVYNNATYTFEQGQLAIAARNAAAASADIASAKVNEINLASADVRAALDAIKAGPVASVNGQTGVISGLVTERPVSLGNVDLSSAAAMRTGFWRYETPSNGPAGFNVSYGQLLVSHAGDTVCQTIFDYSTGLVWSRSGAETTIASKSWKPLGNHPVRYVDDTMNYMYDEVNGGLNTVNVFRAPSTIAKYLPKYPTEGDLCTVVVANGRADNSLHPAAGTGHQIMGLAEPITLDSSSLTVTFMWVPGGYGWRIV